MQRAKPSQYPPSGYDSTPGIAPPPGIVVSYASAPGTFAPTVVCTFGPNPQAVVCPFCHTRTTTRVKAESSSKTHLMAALLCLACCCCIPYCVDSCKNRNHYCISCGAYVGAYTN